ncbi:MAG: hypothetical protein LBL16_04715 [Endomicrobium sp.]|jgi:hypothetical protein|nr:hypothetical protein [Endomicrobium sp.]
MKKIFANFKRLQIKYFGKKSFFINNFAHFHFFKDNKANLFTEHYLYVLNSFAADFLFNKGIKIFEFSIEDDFKNISNITKKDLYSNGIFYISGFPVLATSLMKNNDLNQNKQFMINSLKDSFQVLNKSGGIYILPQFPIMLFNKLNALKKLKINKFISFVHCFFMFSLFFLETNSHSTKKSLSFKFFYLFLLKARRCRYRRLG